MNGGNIFITSFESNRCIKIHAQVRAISIIGYPKADVKRAIIITEMLPNISCPSMKKLLFHGQWKSKETGGVLNLITFNGTVHNIMAVLIFQRVPY